MEGRLIIKECTVWTPHGLVPDAAVSVTDDRIGQIRSNAALPVLPGDWEVKARGRLLCASRTEEGLLTRALSQLSHLSAEDVGAVCVSALAQAARRGIGCVVDRWTDIARGHAEASEMGNALVKAASSVGVRLELAEKEPAGFSKHPLVTWGNLPHESPGVFLSEGQTADFALYDWVPPASAPTPEDWATALQEICLAWTGVAGRVIVREGQLVSLDGPSLLGEAARAIEAGADALVEK